VLRDRKLARLTKYAHSRVVCLRLEGNLVRLMAMGCVLVLTVESALQVCAVTVYAVF